MKQKIKAVFALFWFLFLVRAEEPKQFQFIPPAWEGHVVFYHSFEKNVSTPEINTAGLTVVSPGKSLDVQGFQGKALSCNLDHPFRIEGEALSVSRPITVMVWWRLDAPMAEETCFNLIKLCGKDGHIASFVRGKGEWCALKEPTYISQVHGFPEIPNHNNPWGGRAFFSKGEWHHCAISVGNGNDVKIYWDGQFREGISAKGRKFEPKDVFAAELGPNFLAHPLSLDEIIVTNRVLSEEEISEYVKSTMALHRLNVAAGK